MFEHQNLIDTYIRSKEELDEEFSLKLNQVLMLDPSKYHLTASGIVVKNKMSLLIFHRYIKKWFQPGGHIDFGELPHHAAQREVLEETGWQTRLIGNDVPVDIDIHLIPENPIKSQPEHWHIDCAFFLEPLKQSEPVDPEQTKWFELDAIENERVRRLVFDFNSKTD
jgi:8-oxo-dGTP pyrophosphatase MutT (NUDIX family)